MYNRDVRISRFMSLLLRHKPFEYGLDMDEFGYVNVDDLIRVINREGFGITSRDVERIVAEDEKQRYSFSEDRTKIRANQGHSIHVNLQLQPTEPPEVLYHGTAVRFRDSIMREGIKKQGRQYVHLSSDAETAAKVGRRHGKLFIFVVESRQMYKDGYKFYLSQNNVWLTDYVPPKYLKELG